MTGERSNRFGKIRALQLESSGNIRPTPLVHPVDSLNAKEGIMAGTATARERVKKHALPPLPYDYAALEPHIDRQTMEIHYTKHHQAYVNNLNAALDKHPELHHQTLDELLRGITGVPDDIRAAVRNNAGGHHNHSLFWTIMAPAGSAGGGAPSGVLADAMRKSFGDFAKFKEQLSNAAATRFGSGRAWLALAGATLEIMSTAYPARFGTYTTWVQSVRKSSAFSPLRRRNHPAAYPGSPVPNVRRRGRCSASERRSMIRAAAPRSCDAGIRRPYTSPR